MKIKTIVTGCNRKQAKSIALEQEAKVRREETKNKIANKLLNDTKEQLIAKSKELTEAVDKNIELAYEVAELTQTNESLNGQVKQLRDTVQAKELKLISKDEEMDKLKLRISHLQEAIKESDKELALAKRPFWKKVRGKC